MADKSFLTYLAGKQASTTGVSMTAGLNGAGSAVEDVSGPLKVAATGRSSILYPGVHFSLPAGYGAGTGDAVMGALAAGAANGGSDVWLPPEDIIVDKTIDHKYPHVLLHSPGGINNLHGVAAAYACKLIPSFAGTVLKHRTPYAAETGGVPGPRNDGGGFSGISVIGNALATKLLEVDSVSRGTYHLHLDGCVGTTAAHFKVGITGTDLSEATNIQHASVRLIVRQVDIGAPRSCHCVTFEGSSNSNFCFTEDVDLDLQHYDGDGLHGICADNNLFTLRTYRPGGSGLGLRAKGPTASEPVGFQGNTFLRYSSNTTAYAEGTGDPGVVGAITNYIPGLDNLNGTPAPSAGTGSVWVSLNLSGLMRGFASTGFVVSDNATTAITERDALGVKGLVIANGSESHLTLQNNAAAAKWLFRLMTATGNIQLLRQAGTGYFDLGAVDAKMNVLRITDGVAAPSAVAGQVQIYADTSDGDLKAIFADGTVKTIVTDT